MDEFNYRPSKHHKIKDYWLPALFMVAFLTFTGWLVATKVIPSDQKAEVAVDNLKSQIIENQSVSKEALEELNKKPPEHQNNKLSTKTVGNTTFVSEGSLSQVQIDHLSQLTATANNAVSPNNLRFTDTTGQFANLIDPLKAYMSNSLLWTARELPSLYEVRLVNAGQSGWSGMYYGGYTTVGGKITSVTAYIELNTYYYQSSPYILEYLQLVLSHEYGHHYTLYNKWMSGYGYADRFPDAYYQVRPLSQATTAVDYSKGWGNCDAEIAAEDYKYLFSPYKNQQMAATYGYPSDPATRNYFLGFGGATNNVDSTPPAVSISTPASSAKIAGSTTFSATASDNIAVTGVDFYLNDQLIGSASKSGEAWQLAFNSLSQPNGDYSLKAKAKDQANNVGTSPVVIFTILNTTPDSTPPTVTITSPADGQTVSGTITLPPHSADNSSVNSATFALDATNLIVKTAAPYSLNVNTLDYTNGSHTLSVVASDGVNNTTKSITINIFNTGGTPDTEKPTVQITAPSSSPYTWASGNLVLTALGTDNIGVVKIEFYINDSLVATENSGSISRRWNAAGTPVGAYTLKARAYDAAGNTTETSVVINKS